MGKIEWTQEQTELARKMIRRNASDLEFRAEFGKSKAAARARLDREVFRTMRASMPPIRVQGDNIVVPPGVIADREMRMKSQRSLTAILMGDPEPGRRRL